MQQIHRPNTSQVVQNIIELLQVATGKQSNAMLDVST